ncbi:hypothetical protein ACTMTF_46485 [Nonomuraea sp. ZG12]|uniref:hypothetical protein n=1 Tax=Nonomuraea sp. ZG12 TaxID=3452207 RepID=UPI003F8A9655
MTDAHPSDAPLSLGNDQAPTPDRPSSPGDARRQTGVGPAREPGVDPTRQNGIGTTREPGAGSARRPSAGPAADAVAHVRARSGGPVPLGAAVPAPGGMLRLSRHDYTGQALPLWPDGVTPSLLEEHQVAPMPVERAGETRRVLAAVLTCCWSDHSTDPWPGDPAPMERVLDTYRALIGRSDDLMRNWAIGALRRLHDSAWIVMADGIVSLGPRCALWPVESQSVLKDLVRRIPEPERRALTVVPDADLVAAARVPTAPDTDPVAASRLPDATPADQHTDAAIPTQTTPAGRHTEGVVAAEGTPTEGPDPEAGDRPAPWSVVGGRVESGVVEFDDLLSAYDERRRAELVAAFMVVEHTAEPVQEARFAALRDPALRRTLGEMLTRRGRTLIQHRERWISGYDDEAAAAASGAAPTPPTGVVSGVASGVASAPPRGVAASSAFSPPARPGGPELGESERAVLTLVLVHSVAIPRAEGLLPEDSWLSPHPTPADELRRHTQLPIGELEAALRVLRHAGLLTQVKAGEEAGGYVPGPQFHRLTPAARRRLQEELILAAGPDTPLAAAVRARRSAR